MTKTYIIAGSALFLFIYSVAVDIKLAIADCTLPLGHIDYCQDCGPCGAGEGDCDTNSECESGLTCVQVTGTDYCQSGGGCSLPMGHLDYCSDPDCGPCGAGEGDCDTNSECESGLTCVQVTGTDYCQSGGGCTLPAGHLDYCSDPDCGPCGAGEGDCDTNSECESGLTCVQVTGTDYCQAGSDSCADDHPDFSGQAVDIGSLTWGVYWGGGWYWTIPASICTAGDIDYFYFKASDWAELRVYTTGTTDTYGVVHQTFTYEIYEVDDDSGEGANFSIGPITLGPDEWVKIRVTHSNFNSGTGPYTLVILEDLIFQ